MGGLLQAAREGELAALSFEVSMAGYRAAPP
jgi:hypothetical protein